MGTKRRNWTTDQGQWDKGWKYNSFLLSRMDQGKIKSFSYNNLIFLFRQESIPEWIRTSPLHGTACPIYAYEPSKHYDPTGILGDGNPPRTAT